MSITSNIIEVSSARGRSSTVDLRDHDPGLAASPSAARRLRHLPGRSHRCALRHISTSYDLTPASPPPPTTSTRNDRTVVLSSCPGAPNATADRERPVHGRAPTGVATLGPIGGRRRPRRPHGRRTRRRADRALLRRRHRPGDRTARRFQAIRRLIVYEPGVRVGGLVPADQVELIEQLVGRGDPRQLLLALAGDKDDARWAELRCRSETAQTLGLWRQVVTAVASSSATSSVTRRAISSRVARTSSTGRPLGSSSSQSM